jgi:ribosomal protein S18 acetylase RimI-like enzyme
MWSSPSTHALQHPTTHISKLISTPPTETQSLPSIHTKANKEEQRHLNNNPTVMPPPPNFTVRPATLDDVSSLTTIVPRSFHPTNPYIRALVPDTPTIRQWWLQVFTSELATLETSYLLVAVAATEDKGKPSETLGVLSMQLLNSREPGAGFWSTVPPTADHNIAAYEEIASSISDARLKLRKRSEQNEQNQQSQQNQQTEHVQQSEQHQQHHQDHHFVISLFGVSHQFKGHGLGKKLLLQACSIADAAGLEIFVMANASARGVYMHPEIGFEVRDMKVMEGDEGYEEFMLVRCCGGRVG